MANQHVADDIVADEDVNYSENDFFDEMVDKDPSVYVFLFVYFLIIILGLLYIILLLSICREMVGYVESIEGRRQVKTYFLFKFVLTNGERRITCLIWGDDHIQKYQNEILIGRVSNSQFILNVIQYFFKSILLLIFLQIVCLDGAKSKACLLPYNKTEQHFVPFELIIQANTVVTYHGQHQVQPNEDHEATIVTFDDIGEAEGLISEYNQ